MKPKIAISSLRIRLGLFLLLFFTLQQLSAQEDSARFARDSVRAYPVIGEPLLPSLGLSPEKSAISPSLPTKYPYSSPDFSLKESLTLPYQTNPSLLFRGDYHTDGILKQFRHGAFFGSGGQTSIPCIGRINNTSLGYQQALTQKLTLQFGVDAMKINMIHSTGQVFSTSGALLYHPSDRVTFQGLRFLYHWKSLWDDYQLLRRFHVAGHV